jgi:hypothetical protein
MIEMKKTSIKNIFLSNAGSPGMILVLLDLSISSLEVTPAYAGTRSTDTNDGVCGSDCSLHEAIAAASGDTILLGSELVINKDLTINGSVHNVTVSGVSDSGRVGMTGSEHRLHATWGQVPTFGGTWSTTADTTMSY